MTYSQKMEKINAATVAALKQPKDDKICDIVFVI